MESRRRQLLGVVLCGGESRRMGRDKGMMTKDGQSWARHMGALLGRAGMQTVYSINARQEGEYSHILQGEALIMDNPALSSVWGPLRGLLTVHEAYPGRDLFLIACDMIDMDGETIDSLIEAYVDGGGFDFYVYRGAGAVYEPFCGIYTAAGLAASHLAALEGRLVDFSLQRLLREGKTNGLAEASPSVFRNYNQL